MVELMSEVGFGIPVMPQGAFYVFADASRFTDDSYRFAFELLEKAGVGVAPGVDFGQMGRGRGGPGALGRRVWKMASMWER